MGYYPVDGNAYCQAVQGDIEGTITANWHTLVRITTWLAQGCNATFCGQAVDDACMPCSCSSTTFRWDPWRPFLCLHHQQHDRLGDAQGTRITCASEGYTGTKLTWCQNICEKGYTGATLDMWIHRWVNRYRDLPYCGLGEEEGPPQEG